MWFQLAIFVARRDVSSRPDDCLDGEKTHVVLSTEDCLVQARAIVRYLASGDIPTTVLEGAEHAGFLLDHEHMKRVLGIISDMVDRVERAQQRRKDAHTLSMAAERDVSRPRGQRRNSSYSLATALCRPVQGRRRTLSRVSLSSA
jgi:hypothetical protein